ncbi:MAG: hypothetical protein M3Z21_16425 [Pseudomonadota bacterium]|nr:hypothetical protein [Pseudomonadota bacterium]
MGKRKKLTRQEISRKVASDPKHPWRQQDRIKILMHQARQARRQSKDKPPT